MLGPNGSVIYNSTAEGNPEEMSIVRSGNRTKA